MQINFVARKKERAKDGIVVSAAVTADSTVGVAAQSAYKALMGEAEAWKKNPEYWRNAHVKTEAGLEDAKTVAQFADSILRQSYVFDKYKTMNGPSVKPHTVNIEVDDPAAAEAAFAPLRAVTESSFWAADLANEPPNVLYPETYAQRIKSEMGALGARVHVLDENNIKALGMNALYDVAKGSAHPPRVVIVEYDGTQGRQKQPDVLIGKGVTFDTGGISLKPGANMDDMKYDMGGSAAVLGAIRAAAARKAPVRLVAMVGLVENMPDGLAQVPGSIVTTMKGLTVNVGNTDAEGRLVLCDLLYLAQHSDRLKTLFNVVNFTPFTPRRIIDAATLTGAQVVALGNKRAAVYANEDSLTAKFNKAGDVSGELCWPMPLGEEYAQDMLHKHADLNNIGGKAGSCTAAAFLHYFIDKDEAGKDKVQWAHVDMAGPGIATPGWGVRVFNQVIADYFEEKAQGSGSAHCGGGCKCGSKKKGPDGPSPAPQSGL